MRTQVTKELQQKGKIGEISTVEDVGLLDEDDNNNENLWREMNECWTQQLQQLGSDLSI